jgi:hypothetical protein
MDAALELPEGFEAKRTDWRRCGESISPGGGYAMFAKDEVGGKRRQPEAIA